MEPRNHEVVGPTMLTESDGSIGCIDMGERHSAYRGRRAGRAHKGHPRNLGDPVVSFRKRSRRGEPGEQSPGPWAATRSVPRERKESVSEGTVERRTTKRTGKGGRKSEHPHNTEEIGEPAPGDPVEGRGMPGDGTV
jgi:hypothetical protein